MAEPVDDDAEEERRFALLEAYLADLQAGRPVDPAKLLPEHPDLTPALGCLESLHQLAAPLPVTKAAPNSEPTVEWSNQASAAEALAPNGGSLFGDYELLEEIGRGG